MLFVRERKLQDRLTPFPMVSGLWLSDLLKRYSPLSPRFATFVWREVVVALRWRRLVGFWLITTGILFFLSIQVTPGAPTFAVLGFSVLSPVFFSSFFANSFAIDGAGLPALLDPADEAGAFAESTRSPLSDRPTIAPRKSRIAPADTDPWYFLHWKIT